MVKQKREKILTSALSELYADLLKIDAWLAGNSKSAQAKSLIQAKLNEKEGKIHARIEQIAKKKGMSKDELWDAILADTAGDNETPEN